MAIYTHMDLLRSGLPLGGIGAGTVEFFPDGTRGAFTGLNNWSNPLGQLHSFRSGPFGDYRAAHPFALMAEDGVSKFTGLLQTLPSGGLPTIGSIRMEGRFPVAKLTFEDERMPVSLELTAFSPFIPGNPGDSAIPAAMYRFTVRNPGLRPVVAALMAAAVNCAGSWNVGRYNDLCRRNEVAGVAFAKDHAAPGDPAAGTVALLTKDGPGVSVCDSRQFVRKCFRDLAPDDLIVPGWDEFCATGVLPKGDGPRRLEGEYGEWSAALAHRLTLQPGESAAIDFVYSWHAPNHPYGHQYERRFGDAAQVGEYALAHFDRLLAGTCAWQCEIEHSPLPGWLSDALINNLYPLVSGSWWVKDGRFAQLECPTHHPLLGTLDVHYYGSLPLALMYPGLEKSLLRQFAQNQFPDGYIPHDLGKNQLDCPSAGTSAGPRWKDLCPKFVLLVYQSCLLWNDTGFLREMYPHVIRAMNWEAGTDCDGDGLPESEGMDCTFDNWDLSGVSSYAAGIYLAALRAAEESAKMLGVSGDAEQFRSRYSRAAARFDELLWTGRYYLAVAGQNGTAKDCTASQLNGQWYAHLLGLGHILPADRVRQAVRTMLDLNGMCSPYGAVNSVSPQGQAASEDEVNHQAGNIWPGETYALAALAIYEGFVDEGLALASKTYANLAGPAGCLWNQPDVVRADDGCPFFGDDYERNMSIWTIIPALAFRDPRMAPLWRGLVDRAAAYARGDTW